MKNVYLVIGVNPKDNLENACHIEAGTEIEAYILYEKQNPGCRAKEVFEIMEVQE